ncbi:hypothetical protein, partial [Pseudomonas aeruginosa]
RYLPEVRRRVGRLTVVCHKSLHRLVKCLPCVDEVREDISGDHTTTFMQLPPLLSSPVTIPDATIILPEENQVREMVDGFGA